MNPTEPRRKRAFHRLVRGLKAVLPAILGALLLLAALECLLGSWLAHPQWIPANDRLLAGMRSVYIREDWNVLQADPQLVEYDGLVTYRLRPGQGAFENREFKTTVVTNSEGLRDDEESLTAPQILVLGDSYGMGWGVENSEAFPQQLENITGHRVLNVSVSSYGTPRELLLAERFDLSQVQLVVIQYFFNDYRENRTYLDGGFELPITSREAFDEVTRSATANYRPLNYLRAFFNRSTVHPELEGTPEGEVAEALLEILDRSERLTDLPIVLFQINPWSQDRFNIVPEIQKQLESGAFPDLEDRLSLVETQEFLDEQDFFILDPHLRLAGHETLARELAPNVSGILRDLPRSAEPDRRSSPNPLVDPSPL